MNMLRDARVTVVGSGAMGAAALYALTQAGHEDVQLVEAGDLTAQTTAQAAGIVGQVRSSVEQTRLSMESAEFYRRMERDLGAASDWRETGSLRIALSDRTANDYRRLARVAEEAGLEVELVDAARVRELCPGLERVDDVRLALWCPSDGYVQPNSVASAYIHAARAAGARVVPHTRVEKIVVHEGRVTGLVTDRGEISTETVVVAAGPWAGVLARTAGVELPIVPVLVQHFVTSATSAWDSGSVCLRVPERYVYTRGEGDGFLVGGFESPGTSLDPRSVPGDATLPDEQNWDALAEYAHGISTLVPSITEMGVRTVFRGWPGFTPDGNFVIGPVGSVPGLVMAAGCNAHGVQGSYQVGRDLVESLTADPSTRVRAMSPNRFVESSWDWDEARRQAQAVCENYYPRTLQVKES